MNDLVTQNALDPKSLAALMDEETDRRKTLRQFIAKNLEEGVDWGTIPIGGRESKACLFKPGAEKFCSLLQLRAEFSKDEETLSMIGTSEGIIAYVCRLIHVQSGRLISEGRGACALKEKQGIVNTTIKIAEKRAQIDAVLRLGLSDSFTQDLEDMNKESDRIEPLVKKQEIKVLVNKLGYAPETREEYEALIGKLTSLTLKPELFDEIISRLENLVKEALIQS